MDLVADILAGRVRAIARALRLVEDDPEAARPLLKEIYKHTGLAWLVGLTGSPGVGKSSLVDRLIAAYRAQGLTVAVVAVDPTSPFSGGALLGDRVRMQAQATDPGVYIRSLATRGAFGGLTPAVRGAVMVLDAAGFDRVLIETVGVGQDEVDIVRLANTTVVITVPGLGDEVQALKAGIMEIADLLVVNKADRPGADQAAQELRGMLDLARLAGQERPWWPRIVPTTARTGAGIADLVAAIETHRRFLTEERPEVGAAKGKTQLTELIIDLIKDQVLRRTQVQLNHSSEWDDRLGQIATRQLDPFSLAEEMIARAG